MDADHPRSNVRLAGRGRSPDGSVVTWTVAEGAKGRRWREVVVDDGAIVHSLLLETFPDGGFAHLELSTAAGLLTLHPEGDGTLHGNAVTAGGVRPVVRLPWPDGSVVLIEGSAVAAAAAAASMAARDGRVACVRIDSELSLASTETTAAELGRGGGDGLPALGDAEVWPLELDETE